MDEFIIQECCREFPEAENDIVAVDLKAQKLFKEIQHDLGNIPHSKVQLKISRYNYLRDLRGQLFNNRVEEMSSFVVRN